MNKNILNSVTRTNPKSCEKGVGCALPRRCAVGQHF